MKSVTSRWIHKTSFRKLTNEQKIIEELMNQNVVKWIIERRYLKQSNVQYSLTTVVISQYRLMCTLDFVGKKNYIMQFNLWNENLQEKCQVNLEINKIWDCKRRKTTQNVRT